MTEIDYSEIDFGIRELVRAINAHGFETTDSGDGASKFTGGELMACAESTPNVHMEVDPDDLIAEADRLVSVLRDLLKPGVLDEEIEIANIGMARRVSIDAAYLPMDSTAILSVRGADDRDLR